MHERSRIKAIHLNAGRHRPDPFNAFSLPDRQLTRQPKRDLRLDRPTTGAAVNP
jgi:hypothetical protein